MIIYHMNELTVRTLEDKDAEKLAEWLSNPVVLQYYEGRDKPHDIEMVKDVFYHKDHNTCCMIEYKGKEIGYIQFYMIHHPERQEYGYMDEAQKIFGTDQFIGEASYWNKGIGTLLMKTMVSYLGRECKADKILVDPQTWNERAIACYEKCGFRKVKLLPEHEWHEGRKRDSWLMEYVF